MSDAWDEMERAKENEYFLAREREALERIRSRSGEPPLRSPVTGKPMERVTVSGVVVDRCTDSGGVWLDKGELEEILRGHDEKSRHRGAYTFFRSLFTA